MEQLLPDTRYWRSALRVDDPPVWTHLFLNRIEIDAPELDQYLRWVGDGNSGDVIISDDDFSWLYSPYDGGGDVIAPTTHQRDQLRDTHPDWLSRLPSGL